MASSIPNRGPELLGVNIAFLCTAVIAYALRVYVRMRMVKAFGRDDYLMGVATVSILPSIRIVRTNKAACIHGVRDLFEHRRPLWNWETQTTPRRQGL